MIVGIPRTSDKSTVSICGQNGKAASAISSMLVWRMRQSNSCTYGLTMPLISMLLGQGIFLHVFAHHAGGAVSGAERDNGAADFLDPLARDAVRVAVVERGNHFLRQHTIKICAVATILLLDRSWMRVITNREAIRAVVAFAPPAIEDR